MLSIIVIYVIFSILVYNEKKNKFYYIVVSNSLKIGNNSSSNKVVVEIIEESPTVVKFDVLSHVIVEETKEERFRSLARDRKRKQRVIDKLRQNIKDSKRPKLDIETLLESLKINLF